MKWTRICTPPRARQQLAWSLTWISVVLCLALDAFCLWTLANSPQWGARFRMESQALVVRDLEAGSDLQRSGLRNGDIVLSIAGRSVDPAAFLTEPEDYASWHDRDLFWDWQRFLTQLTAKGKGTMLVRRKQETHLISFSIHPLGWVQAWKRSAALRVVGWVFLLVPFLVRIKKLGECSLVLFLAGIGVFASLCTEAVFNGRDLCLDPSSFAALGAINYVMSLSAVITLHLGWILPTQVSWLKKYPRMRLLPWTLCALTIALHFGSMIFLPPAALYILIALSLLGFMLTVLLRLRHTADPILRSQLEWVALAAIGGFLPFVIFTALPITFGITPVPVNLTLLSAVLAPFCLAFAVFRYRLLDVERIFDWVLVHAVVLGSFSIFEMVFWNWLSSSYAPNTASRPLLIAFSMFVVVAVYAPLRTWLFHLLIRLSGRARPRLTDTLHNLLEQASSQEDPRAALEQTLRWTLKPAQLSWLAADQIDDVLLQRLEGVQYGLLGYELGEMCPENMESTAWVPVQTGQGMAAVVLWPQGARGWTRQDLRIARTLGLFVEPLLKIQRMQHQHSLTTNAMREQREEMLREMHDGLGSQLFGASLLTHLTSDAPAEEMRKRMAEANLALLGALDSLRTGLSILSSPPGAFGPALLALLLRGERVLNAAGIQLETQVDDEVVSLQLESRILYGILRIIQEGLTNIARHAHCSHASVRISLQDATLLLSIKDDGIGFDGESVIGGYGLHNMKLRMQSMGGSAAIHSAPGKGCTLALTLELKTDKEEERDAECAVSR